MNKIKITGRYYLDVDELGRHSLAELSESLGFFQFYANDNRLEILDRNNPALPQFGIIKGPNANAQFVSIQYVLGTKVCSSVCFQRDPTPAGMIPILFPPEDGENPANRWVDTANSMWAQAEKIHKSKFDPSGVKRASFSPGKYFIGDPISAGLTDLTKVTRNLSGKMFAKLHLPLVTNPLPEFAGTPFRDYGWFQKVSQTHPARLEKIAGAHHFGYGTVIPEQIDVPNEILGIIPIPREKLRNYPKRCGVFNFTSHFDIISENDHVLINHHSTDDWSILIRWTSTGNVFVDQ